VLFAVAAACGRYRFDPRVAPNSDTAPDTPAAISLVSVVAPGYQGAAQVTDSVDGTLGDFLVAAIYWDESPDTVTLADTLGLAWASLPAQGIPSVCGGSTGNATGAQLWYAPVTVSGLNSITATQTSGTQPLGLFVLEYAGIDNANPIDATSAQIAPASSNNVFMPELTAHDDDVIVALFNDTISFGTMTAGSGFTIEAHDDQFPNLLEDAIVQAGTYTPTAALPPGEIDACWIGTAMALRAH